MHVGEALDVTQQIVSNDVRNRVKRILARLDVMANRHGRDPKMASQPLVGRFQVDEEIGVLRPLKPFREGFGRWQNRYALHFVSDCFHPVQSEEEANSRYVYWFNVPAHECDFRFWKAWEFVDCTFQPTVGLMQALWKESFFSHGSSPGLPARKGFDLVEVTGNRGTLQRLELEGVHIKLANFQLFSEVKSIDRQISDGFITQVQLPGSSYWWECYTVEGVLTLLNRIQEVKVEMQTSVHNTPIRVDPDAGGDNEHSEFLTVLKSQCYAIKASHGNQTGKAVFEVYKEIAKYLSKHQEMSLVKDS